MSRADEVDARARLAAQRVVGHLEGERLIQRFIDSYIMGFDRKQLKNPPDKFIERSNQLGRLVAEKGGGRFYRLRLGPLKVPDGESAGRFRQKFWESLAVELKLGADAGAALARDAEDYADVAARAALFRQRVAPPMKDKAEHAGQKFYEALDQVAEQVVARASDRS